MKFGVQYSEFTNKIYVGKLNKAKTEFLEKEDKTGEVLGNVLGIILENNKVYVFYKGEKYQFLAKKVEK